MASFTEDYMVEQAPINWLKELGYSYLHGSLLSPENEERDSYRQVVLKKRFTNSVQKLNPWLTQTQLEEVYKKVTDIEHPDFVMKSKIFYDMITKGVKISVKDEDGERARIVKLVDFNDLENNEFLAANQFVIECQYQSGSFRRPDLIVFINGLPFVLRLSTCSFLT